jgi:putative glutamine amidotransferase
MERRPVIGICTALERAQWSVWDQRAALIPVNYLDAIRRADGLALLLAPDPALTAAPDEALDLLDGLMLIGGADIDPASYGAELDPATVDPVPERDAFEIALTRGALARRIPLLGICRGMQLLNVALGGTLDQHLPERFGHHEHLRARGSFDGADHDVRLVPGSLAARAAGEGLHGTKSHHHQGVDRVGEGLVVTGTATIDGLPEALELPGADFVLGVQWHPEADERSRVIGALVEAARAYAAGQAGSATTASISTSASRGRPATANAARAGGSVSKNEA